MGVCSFFRLFCSFFLWEGDWERENYCRSTSFFYQYSHLQENLVVSELIALVFSILDVEIYRKGIYVSVRYYTWDTFHVKSYLIMHIHCICNVLMYHSGHLRNAHIHVIWKRLASFQIWHVLWKSIMFCFETIQDQYFQTFTCFRYNPAGCVMISWHLNNVVYNIPGLTRTNQA